MIEKDFLIKIKKLVLKDPNEILSFVCQEDFFNSLPFDVLSKISTTVIVDNLESASSLRTRMHNKNIQNNKIRIIHENNFSGLNPVFDFIIIGKKTLHMKYFIRWLIECNIFQDFKTTIFKNNTISKVDHINSKWHVFTKDWMYTDIVLKTNASIPQNHNKSKFHEESIEEDEYV